MTTQSTTIYNQLLEVSNDNVALFNLLRNTTFRGAINLPGNRIGLVFGDGIVVSVDKVVLQSEWQSERILSNTAETLASASVSLRTLNSLALDRGSKKISDDLGKITTRWKAEEFVTPELVKIESNELEPLPNVIEEKKEEIFDMGREPRKRVFGEDDWPSMPWLDSVTGAAKAHKPSSEEGW